jgi:hypothetical protein
MSNNNSQLSKTTVDRFMVNLNTTHWVTGTNRYRLNFSSPLDLRGKKASLCMYQYGIYNSTYNISSKLGNNTYQIKWVNGTVYNCTMPDGYYDFSAINLNIQYNLVKNKLYLQNTTNASQVLYYISVSANTIQYASEININHLPSTLPTGYQIPTGATWSMPTNATYPQLILSSGLRKLFGFKEQTSFPLSQSAGPMPVNVGFISDTFPILSPIFTYMLTCNMISSNVSPVPTLFYQIPLTKSFGSLISETVIDQTGLSINSSIYNFIEITLLDQDYNTLSLIDPELTISVVIEVESIQQN